MPLLDEPTALRVRHSFEACVCAELAVDVVQVIAERLGRNTQRPRDGRGTAPFREQFEDATLLI